jgi:SWI/SNF-related matrix-associated actin-dependent regulator of chromatin subfamily A3
MLSKSREGSPPREELDPALVRMIQARLAKAVEDSEECSICFDLLRNPRILPCQHYYCLECILEVGSDCDGYT